VLFGPKVERFEKRVKELNAIKGEYRGEIDDALHRLRERRITREEFERIKQRNEEKMEKLSEKIRELRAQISAMKE